MGIKGFLYSLLVCGLFSCDSKSGSSWKFIEPCLSKTIGSVEYSLCAQTNIKTDDELKNFVLKLRKPGKKNNLIYEGGEKTLQDRVTYYSFDFKKDVFLEIDGVRSENILFNFSRNYNISPYLEFAMAFDIPNDSDSKNIFLIIHDKPNNTGLVKIPINQLTI